MVPRSQLAINCPAPLLERLRAAAVERGATISSLVLAWVEAGLDAGLDPSRSDLDQRLDLSRPAPRSDLDQRLDAVERRLDALEVPAPARAASPQQVRLPAQPGEPLPDRRLTPAEAAGPHPCPPPEGEGVKAGPPSDEEGGRCDPAPSEEEAGESTLASARVAPSPPGRGLG